MIDNVRQTMARMAAIRTTMAGRQGAVAQPSGTTTSGQSLQALFAQAMSQAGAGSSLYNSNVYNTGGLTPAAGPVRSGAPPGFETYQNGQLPYELLGSIAGTNERMWAPAASAFEHMRADAANAGVDLTVVDAYRPVEDQYKLAHELGLYSQGGKAAVPGTSQHGWGRALDLELNDQGVAWLRANAWKYGYVETVPREPWHWEFHPAG